MSLYFSLFVGSIGEGGDKTLINSLEWKKRISLSLSTARTLRANTKRKRKTIFVPISTPSLSGHTFSGFVTRRACSYLLVIWTFYTAAPFINLLAIDKPSGDVSIRSSGESWRRSPNGTAAFCAIYGSEPVTTSARTAALQVRASHLDNRGWNRRTCHWCIALWFRFCVCYIKAQSAWHFIVGCEMYVKYDIFNVFIFKYNIYLILLITCILILFL